MDRIRRHLEDAERALLGIRGVLREMREAPAKEKSEAAQAYRSEMAKVAYRLRVQGVTTDVLGEAFGMNRTEAQRLVIRGEILCHRGQSRDQRIEQVNKSSLALWDSGLFSPRVARLLFRSGIQGIDDLCERTPSELMAVPGMGVNSLREIERVLGEMERELKR